MFSENVTLQFLTSIFYFYIYYGLVGGLLSRLGLPYTHLASPQPLLYKQANLKVTKAYHITCKFCAEDSLAKM